jgi:hypothetical protein
MKNHMYFINKNCLKNLFYNSLKDMLFDNNFNSFLVGLISGSIQSIVGHPLDTIKVLFQNNKIINFHKINKNNRLFNGLTPILLTNSLLTGSQFYLYEKYSPIILGLGSALLTTPIEYYKIQKQIFGKYPDINTIVNTKPRGFTITFLRETIALNCYFNLYHYLEKPLGVFISGGIAGSMSWLLTYQIDTVKSRIQAGDSFEKAMAKQNFNKGLIFCLVRGFIVNGCGFLGASFVKN